MLSDVNVKFYIVAGHLTVGRFRVVFKGGLISNSVYLRSTEF